MVTPKLTDIVAVSNLLEHHHITQVMSKISDKLLKVFVYGTLKRGEPNHHWLTQSENGLARFLCEGKTNEKYPLVVGTRYNIPFLLDKRGVGHNVIGEIYEIDHQMLSKLDILEDYPNYYDREIQSIETCDKECRYVDCWLYVIRNFPEKLLHKQHLECYHNTPELQYSERSKREDNYKPKNDLDY